MQEDTQEACKEQAVQLQGAQGAMIGFQVMSQPCNQCLFSSNKIVSDERRKQLLAECLDENKYFVCHKATLVEQDICCKSFYDQLGARINTIRLAERLGIVEFVDEPHEN